MKLLEKRGLLAVIAGVFIFLAYGQAAQAEPSWASGSKGEDPVIAFSLEQPVQETGTVAKKSDSAEKTKTGPGKIKKGQEPEKPTETAHAKSIADKNVEEIAREMLSRHPLPPGDYYALVLDRQKLTISSNLHIIRILTAHHNDPLRAMKDLKMHELERQYRTKQLFQKYGISPDDYYRSTRGTEHQRERSKYLDDHPEIRDRIADNSSEIVSLEKRIWSRMNYLWRSQQPS